MLELRERERVRRGAAVIFKPVSDDVALLAKLSAHGGDAEDHDEVHSPRNSRRVVTGARGAQAAEPGPQETGDDGAVEHGNLLFSSDSNLDLFDRVEREDEALDESDDSGFGIWSRSSSCFRVVRFEEIPYARVEALSLLLHFNVTQFFLERTPERYSHKVERHGEREASDDGDAANHLQITTDKQSRRKSAFGARPVNLLQDWRIFIAVGRDEIIDIGTRITRCDEVEDNGDQNHELEESGEFAIRFDKVEDLIVGTSARKRIVPMLGERLGGSRRWRRAVISHIGAVHNIAVAGDAVCGDCTRRQGVPFNRILISEGEFRHALHLDAERTESRQVEETESDRRDECALDHLPDSSSAGNSRDEHADEWGPRDPPSPVEDGPVVHELVRRSFAPHLVQLRFCQTVTSGCINSIGDSIRGARLTPCKILPRVALPGCVTSEYGGEHGPGIAIPADLRHPLHVVAKRLHERVEQEEGTVSSVQTSQEDETNPEGNLREYSDAILKTKDNGGARDGGDDPDDQNLCRFTRDVNVVVQSSHGVDDGIDAKTERSAHTKSCGSDRKRVDAIAEQTVDIFTQERVERVADGHRLAVAVADNSQRHCDENVWNPAVQTPVEQSEENSLLSLLVIVHDWNFIGQVSVINATVVVHRFCDSKLVQADADTASEKHGKPFVIAECRFFVIATELDVLVLRE